MTGIAGEQVLDQERHTAKWPVGQLTSRGVAGVVEPADGHRVEFGIDPFDPLDGRVEQLQRRHLAAFHQGGLVDRIHPSGLIGE